MSIRGGLLGSFSLPAALVAFGLAAMSVAEFVFSRPTETTSTPAHAVAAVLVCGAIALVPSQPQSAVAFGCCATVIEAVAILPGSLFGTGLALLVLAYSVAYWFDRSSQIWGAPLLIGTSLVRDLQQPGISSSDAAIDLFLVLLAFGIGTELRRRGQRARDLETDLARADARIADAIDDERTRLARELHDIVAHSVSIMVVQAGTSRPLADRESRELHDVLTTIETTGREALLELRRLLGVLRGEPLPVTHPMPRMADVKRVVDRMRQSGLDVTLSMEPVPHLSRGLDLCVYRVVQEGLTNALRHAPASKVTVLLEQAGNAVSVSVTDDGSGRAQAAQHGSGVGLIGLRERVTLFGGTLDAGPHERGYRVRALLPITDTTHAESRAD